MQSPLTTNHRLQALNLLPGNDYFATILLIDRKGHWSSLWEEFTTLRRQITIKFTQLEVVNDGDGTLHNDTSSEVEIKFRIHRGKFISQRTDGMEIKREISYHHDNFSDKVYERYIDLRPYNFDYDTGPEVITLENRDLAVSTYGIDDDTSRFLFLEFHAEDPAFSPLYPLELPMGLGKEQVINKELTLHARAPVDDGDLEYKTKVVYSIEYMA